MNQTAEIYRPYQAPRDHGECLVDPPVDRSQEMLGRNRAAASRLPPVLADLRDEARAEMIEAATRYTRGYRDVDQSLTGPIIMAGHQPTLFHPGVWFKNVMLDSVAKRCGAAAINLVVDSDVAGPSSIRVPHLDGDGRLVQSNVAFDQLGGGVPYEQSLIEDRDRFDVFDAHVTETLGSLVESPAVGPLWVHAREAIRRCGFAGCALAQARHRLEEDLGLSTLEVPQSVICRTPAFSRFAFAILSELPRFHEAYNSSADHYRAAHGIRSRAHPVPNLGREDDWYEAPFWVYGNQSPKRKSVWVRRRGNELELSDLENRSRRISAEPASGPESLHALATPEFKFRSRALVTTMFARLILSDLFLHGIGGGKYDQLGDLISRDFWGLTSVPEFVVTSATVRLPGHERLLETDLKTKLRSLRNRLREMTFHPECFPLDGDRLEAKVAEKQALLERIPAKRSRFQWHQEITRLNEELSANLEPLRRETESQIQSILNRMPEAALWASRDHSFSVYPLDYLTSEFARMAK
ncbi:MAG: hypothetical protein AAFV88_21990 [Planctomycetota bacterium]